LKSRASQILHSVANGFTTSTFTQVAVLPWRYIVEMALQTRYTLRRNAAIN